MTKRLETAEDIRALGTILGVWAHPDDESFLAAGVLATAARNGQNVVCVTATRGEAGVQDVKRWPPEQLAAIRTAEMRAAKEILGIGRHFWLNYRDGHCAAAVAQPAAERLRLLIERFQPDSIITFGPEGLTGHPDHRAVSHWATLAARRSRPRPRIYHAVLPPERYAQYLVEADAKLNIFFNIAEPPVVDADQCAIAYELPEDIIELKHRAFVAMPSQMERLSQVLPDQKFHQAFGAEYFVEYKLEDHHER